MFMPGQNLSLSGFSQHLDHVLHAILTANRKHGQIHHEGRMCEAYNSLGRPTRPL